LAAVALILSGCASSEPRVAGGRYRAGHPSYKVGAPYQINGVWYYPKVDYNYDESGVASWYGEAFDQQVTANGEIFDLNDLTAAHRTLPLPSIVEVTNMQNGRQLKLRVNDRGPYAQNRIIDVSRRAAQLLGFERSGTTQVHVQVVKDDSIKVAEAAKRGSTGDVVLAAAAATPVPAPPPRLAPTPERSIAVAELPPLQGPPSTPAVPFAEALAPVQPAPMAVPPGAAIEATASQRSWLIASAHAETLQPSPVRSASALPPQSDRVITTSGSSRIFIQAGAFAVPENAQRARSRFSALVNVEVANIAVHGSPLYRVRLGPVATAEEADRLLSRLVSSGYPDARIVKE
jgi:rare lipoprotein A